MSQVRNVKPRLISDDDVGDIVEYIKLHLSKLTFGKSIHFNVITHKGGLIVATHEMLSVKVIERLENVVSNNSLKDPAYYENIISILKKSKNAGCTRKELAKTLGVSMATLVRPLNLLLKRGSVRRVKLYPAYRFFFNEKNIDAEVKTL